MAKSKPKRSKGSKKKSKNKKVKKKSGKVKNGKNKQKKPNKKNNKKNGSQKKRRKKSSKNTGKRKKKAVKTSNKKKKKKKKGSTGGKAGRKKKGKYRDLDSSELRKVQGSNFSESGNGLHMSVASLPPRRRRRRRHGDPHGAGRYTSEGPTRARYSKVSVIVRFAAECAKCICADARIVRTRRFLQWRTKQITSLQPQ